MLDPIILYSPDGQKPKSIAAIDAPGWIAAGWTTEQSSPVPTEAGETPLEEPPLSHPQTTRKVKNAGNPLPES